MIKKINKIYIWIIVSLLIQYGVLLFLNSYLVRAKSVKIESYDSIEKKEYNDYNIPENVSDIKVSKSIDYAAYIEDDRLKVKNLHEKKNIQTIENGHKHKIIYFKWVHDRNMVMYAISEINNYSSAITLKTFDMDSKNKKEFPTINGLSKNAIVDQIELSTVTNIVYIKISGSENSGILYKFNIMNERFFSMYLKRSNRFSEFNYTDKVIYEKNGKLFLKDGLSSKFSSLTYEGNARLIGIDRDDRAYIGIIDDLNSTDQEPVIKKIIYAKLISDEKNRKLGLEDFKELKIAKNIKLNDIILAESGKIYTYNKLSREFYDIEKDKVVKFYGEFLGINEMQIIYLNGKNCIDFIDLSVI